MINEQIRCKEVRVIGEEGQQLGVMALRDALNMAKDAGVDLVMVSPSANPPVCRIVDYGKFKYEQLRREKEAKKKQKTVEVKEVRLSPNIDVNDLNTKCNSARKFIEKGNKVKVSLRFRGREMAHIDSTKHILEDFAEKLSDIAVIEKAPKMEGHSFVWLNQLMACVATTVEKELHESRIPEQSIRDAVNGARRKGLLVAEKSSGNASGKPLFCVYLRRYWALECDITFLCHTLHHCMNAACGIVSKADVDRAIQNVQMKDGFLLDDTQKQAAYTVYGSDSQNVTVITGGPGSGKTTIIKTIIEAFMVAKGSYYKEEDILLCAPTGRASARMREATGHAASTIQSAYFGCFDNEASVIVVDEFSMCNLETAHMVFSLASHGCKLVIVGDPDQLPAIGAGNVLRDLIDSGEVNVCKLSSCHRNMGAIVENAIHINAGEQTSTFRQDESFLLIPATKGMEIRTTALFNYFHFVRKYGEVNDLDNRHAEDGIRKGVQNICLLTPVRKKGSGYISATDLNLLIRDKLNPATYENSGFIESLKGVPEQGFDYRIGDRVMLCKNHRGSFVNGDMGFITSFEPKALGQDGAMICNAYTVRFDNPCDVDGECFEMIVSRKTMQSEFALAYAMTVHKSQGSEFKAVVVAFDTGWKQLQQRNLLYTAVTRSKNECRIVGNMDAVDVAIDTNDIENRNSLLKNRLQHYNNEKYLDIHMTNFGTSGTDCFTE